jgi:hypothetical protein
MEVTMLHLGSEGHRGAFLTKRAFQPFKKRLRLGQFDIIGTSENKIEIKQL